MLLDDYTVLDFETTGLCPELDDVIEIGAIRIRHGREVARFGCLVHTDKPLAPVISALTGLRADDLVCGFEQKAAFRQLNLLVGHSTLVCHHAAFDVSFYAQAWRRFSGGVALTNDFLCTRVLAQRLLPDLARIVRRANGMLESPYSLANLCAHFQRPRTEAHRALGDCADTEFLLARLLWDEFDYPPSMFDELRNTVCAARGQDYAGGQQLRCLPAHATWEGKGVRRG